MAAHAYLAIDLGAESGRAIVGVLEKGRLELEELHRFRHQPRTTAEGLVWDFEGLWGEVCEGIRLGVDHAARHELELVAVGVDTWGVDFGLLDGAGGLLKTPQCYRDERNRAAAEKVVAAVGHERLYEATGIQFMVLNTLMQVRALQDASPGLLERADQLLFMPDLMHQRLTGEAVAEATIASTSQMLDPRTGAWATELLEQLRIPTGLLPRIVPAGTRLGALREEVAREVGATADLAVILPASHDTAAAVAAVPADPATRWCYLSSGTWSLVGAELDQPFFSDAAREAPFTNEGGVGGTIRFLKNIAGLWLVQECRRAFEQAGGSSDYDTLTRKAAAAVPGRTLLDPGHAPFAAPGDMPGKIADYARHTDQPVPEGEGALVRCCLESLALAYRHTIDQLEHVLGRSFDVLHVVGGGARNELLNQMTADATGREVVVGPVEATAVGNVLSQAMGTGEVRDPEHLRRIVAASFPRQTYQPEDRDPWDLAYTRFLGLLVG